MRSTTWLVVILALTFLLMPTGASAQARVEKNVVEAHRWFRRAHASGHAEAKTLMQELELFYLEEIEAAKPFQGIRVHSRDPHLPLAERSAAVNRWSELADAGGQAID